MSYHIYTTKGLILSDRAHNEADKLYSILTEDLGLIRASGRAVRKESSKLRSSLEPLSLSLISLVKGKGMWRITGASIVEGRDRVRSIEKVFARVSALVEKLVVGEERHPELFKILDSGIEFGHKANLDEELLEYLEILMVTRILFELGYLSRESVPEELFAEDFNRDQLKIVSKGKKALIKSINHGLESSHLT